MSKIDSNFVSTQKKRIFAFNYNLYNETYC